MFGRAVRIDNRDHRDAQTVCFGYRNLFFAHIDHKQRIGQPIHAFNSGKVLFQAQAFAIEFDALFFRQLFIATVGLHRLEVL